MTSCPIVTWQERAERFADSFFTWEVPTEQDEIQPSDLDDPRGRSSLDYLGEQKPQRTETSGGEESPPLTIAPQGRRSHYRLWGQGPPVRSARKVPTSVTEERHKTNFGQGSPKKPTRHGNEKRGTETSGDGYAHGRALFDRPCEG